MKITKSKLKEMIKYSIFDLMEGDDKYVHIGYGRFKEKGKEKDKNAPLFQKTDAGKFIPYDDGDDVGGPAHSNVPKKKKKTSKIDTNPFSDKSDKIKLNKKLNQYNIYIDGQDEPLKVNAADLKSAKSSAHAMAYPSDIKINKVTQVVKKGDDKPEDETGGPSYANVPKGAKSSKEAIKMKQIDKLNKQADKGDGQLIDTEYNGSVVWSSGDPKEDSFIATTEDGEEVEIDYADIIRFQNDDEDESMLKNVQESKLRESIRNLIRSSLNEGPVHHTMARFLYIPKKDIKKAIKVVKSMPFKLKGKVEMEKKPSPKVKNHYRVTTEKQLFNAVVEYLATADIGVKTFSQGKM